MRRIKYSFKHRNINLCKEKLLKFLESNNTVGVGVICNNVEDLVYLMDNVLVEEEDWFYTKWKTNREYAELLFSKLKEGYPNVKELILYVNNSLKRQGWDPANTNSHEAFIVNLKDLIYEKDSV